MRWNNLRNNLPTIGGQLPNNRTKLDNISFDVSFLAVQAASIIASQAGQNYWQVIVINLGLLFLIKLILVLIERRINRSRN